MSRSQEFVDQHNILNKSEAVNKPDENLELSSKNNNSQMHRGQMEEMAYTAYDAMEHHQTFHKQQEAYDEVRGQYEEQAYSSAEQYIQQPTQQSLPNPEKSQHMQEGGKIAYSEGDSGREFDSMPGSIAWKSPTMEEMSSRESAGITLGTAETPKLAKNSQALSENERFRLKLESRRKDVQKGYTRLSARDHSTDSKVRLRYHGRLDLAGEAELAHLGRLKYTGRITREKMTRKDYEELLNRKSRKAFKRRVKGRLLFHGIKMLADEETLSEDELPSSMKRSINRTGRVVMVGVRRDIRTLKKQNNVYIRLEQAKQREKVLRDKRERLLSDAKKREQKAQLRAVKSRQQKKKLKKRMVQMWAREEGKFFQRTWQGLLIKRRGKKIRRQAVKKTLSTIFSLTGIGIFFFIIGIILFLILTAVFSGTSEYYASAVTQNDYGTITDATEYFRKLETDMDEYLNVDRDVLENELETEHGPNIYEYIYQLADFGFSANTLIAYLSAVYGSFTLDGVKGELHSIFEEMYTLTIEVKEEDREVSKYNPDTGGYENVTELKKICYVILEKKELEEVVEPRMTPEQLEQYRNYKLSTGGQQVYGPVMREDWTNLISSNFGERIHPITKERKVHNGVDIAVPVGTHLYSAVDGTVILAAYSESAGNWVKVQTDTGWTVIFMHMDSLTVSAGQTVKKGDHLGYSGNTGRSTGPHLHLEVRNPEDKPLNPIFIIPQTCAQRGREE